MNKKKTTCHTYAPTHNSESKVLPDWFQKYRPSLDKSWRTELIKAHCLIELQHVNKMYEADANGLILTADPKQVIAMKIYNKAALKLVAATQKIAFGPAEDDQDYALVTIGPPMFPGEFTFYCGRASAQLTEGDAVGFVSMVWHVLPTHYRKDSNVDVVWEERHHADMDLNITVPVFTNSKKLNIGDVLYYHAPGLQQQRSDTEKKQEKLSWYRSA